jgi:hypothetical protein
MVLFTIVSICVSQRKIINTEEFTNQSDAIIRICTQNAIIVNNPTEDEITEIVLYILGQTILNTPIKIRSAEVLIPIKVASEFILPK